MKFHDRVQIFLSVGILLNRNEYRSTLTPSRNRERLKFKSSGGVVEILEAAQTDVDGIQDLRQLGRDGKRLSGGRGKGQKKPGLNRRRGVMAQRGERKRQNPAKLQVARARCCNSIAAERHNRGER
jgi:hypothetical protein